MVNIDFKSIVYFFVLCMMLSGNQRIQIDSN